MVQLYQILHNEAVKFILMTLVIMYCFTLCHVHNVCKGRYKTWTLDSGLDYGLDYGFNFGLNWTVASVLALLFKADYECYIAQ